MNLNPQSTPRVHADLRQAMTSAPYDEQKWLLLRVTGSRAPSRRVDEDGAADPLAPPQQSLTFSDLISNEKVNSLPISDDALLQRLAKALKRGERLVIKGRFIPYGRKGPDGAPALHLQVDEAFHLERPSALLGATPTELSQADAQIDALKAQGAGAIYQYIVQRAFLLLGLVTSQSRRFQDLLKLVVLQSLSGGMFEAGTNSRLHLLAASAPGVGKKVFTRLADLLAPVCTVVQPVLLSPVGLSARVQPKAGGGFEAVPGVFPSCAGGVCVIEDFHKVEKNQQKAVQAVLMATAEDGLVSTSKSAAATYDAECGLLLNLNQQSQTQGAKAPQGTAERLLDLSLPAELVSRIDVLMLLGPGDDAVEVTKQMVVKQAAAPLDEEAREQHDAEVRALKILVARLRDRAPVVDLAQVQGSIYQLIEDLAVVVRHQCARSAGTLDGDSMLRRMGNALRKLVVAQARLAGRAEATAEDVEGAWALLRYKLEVLGWVCGDSALPQPLPERGALVKKAQEGVEVQFFTLLKVLGGQRVTLQQAATALGLSPLAVARELWRRGIHPERGHFTIPTLAGYRDAVRLRRLREEAEREAQAAAGVAPVLEAAPLQGSEVVPEEMFVEPEAEVDAQIQQVIKELNAKPVVPKLPEVPLRLHPMLNGLSYLERNDAGRAVGHLLELMDPARDAMAQFDLLLLLGILEKGGGPVGEYAGEATQWLVVADGELRALRSLALYAEADLPDYADKLVARWQEETRPKVREGIEAVVDMLDQARGRPARSWALPG